MHKDLRCEQWDEKRGDTPPPSVCAIAPKVTLRRGGLINFIGSIKWLVACAKRAAFARIAALAAAAAASVIVGRNKTVRRNWRAEGVSRGVRNIVVRLQREEAAQRQPQQVKRLIVGKIFKLV